VILDFGIIVFEMGAYDCTIFKGGKSLCIIQSL